MANHPFDLNKAHTTDKYVRLRCSHLSLNAQRIYAAFTWLEEKHFGLNKPIYAGYRAIANYALIDFKCVKSGLLELQSNGLIFVKLGQSFKKNKKATEIMRKSLEEIRQKTPDENGAAHMLAVKLTERPFMFCGKWMSPRWEDGQTGRVYAKQPNTIQNVDEAARIAGLLADIKPGFKVVYADIKQAEPTILKHYIDYPLDVDVYHRYSDAVPGTSRDSAKKKFLKLSYHPDIMRVFASWDKSAQEDTLLQDYVNGIRVFREKLHAETMESRIVKTRSGRIIAAKKGQQFHAGQCLSWLAQGNVADIINPVCLALMESYDVVLPIHDAVLAVIPTSTTPEMVKALIVQRARDIGFEVQVFEKENRS